MTDEDKWDEWQKKLAELEELEKSIGKTNATKSSVPPSIKLAIEILELSNGLLAANLNILNMSDQAVDGLRALANSDQVSQYPLDANTRLASLHEVGQHGMALVAIAKILNEVMAHYTSASTILMNNTMKPYGIDLLKDEE